MNDIHPVKPEIVPNWTGLLIFLAILGLFLWVLVLVVKWRRKRKQQAVVKVKQREPKESIQEKMLKKLDKLSELIQGEQWEVYYLSVSELVKEYASYKYETDLVELTTREIQRKVDDEELIQLLKELDISKFAELGLDEDSAKTAHEKARTYIAR